MSKKQVDKTIDVQMDKLKQQKNNMVSKGEILFAIITVTMAIIVIAAVIGGVMWWESSTMKQWSDNWELVPGCVDDRIACVSLPILFFKHSKQFNRELNEATHCCIPVCERAYVHADISVWVRACTDTGYYHYRFKRTLYENQPPVFATIHSDGHEDL